MKDLKRSGVTRRRLQARLMPLKLRPIQPWLWDRQGHQDYTVYRSGWEAWKAWAKMKWVA